MEDRGNRQFYLSGVLEVLPARSPVADDAALRACVAFGIVELLRAGTTAVMEFGSYGDEVADRADGRGRRRLSMFGCACRVL